MSKVVDLTGKVFGRLTVLKYVGVDKHKAALWECTCTCGSKNISVASNLKNGNTLSCGCLRRERNIARIKTHGFYRHPLYNTWNQLRARCQNPKHVAYPSYGGRSIKICERWKDIKNFIADVGTPPPGTKLSRRDLNKDYSPANCYWSNTKERSRNKVNSIYLTYRNETKLLIDWAKELGYTRSMLVGRKRKGWSDDKILSPPTRSKRRKRDRFDTLR